MRINTPYMNRRKGCGRRWYSHFGSVVKYIDDCNGTFHTVCSPIMFLKMCFLIWYLGPYLFNPKRSPVVTECDSFSYQAKIYLDLGMNLDI
jgi:hypothetical protein